MSEFGNFTVPVNNTLVCLASSFAFLATDILLCVLINLYNVLNPKSFTSYPPEVLIAVSKYQIL